MTDWQEKVEQVMLAGTSDLRELAKMVGHDPVTFWRDANFRRADLSNQDLSGLDLSQAVLTPRTVTSSLGVASLKEEGSDIETALRALDDALADWPAAPKHVNSAVKTLRSVIKHAKSAGIPELEALARHNVAIANVLLGEYDSAEAELRRARKLYEGLDQHGAVAQCLDTRGMSLLLRENQQDPAAAVQSLDRANSVFRTSAEHADWQRNQIRNFSVFRDSLARSTHVGETSISKLREQIQILEGIWSPTTSFVTAETHVAAGIAHSAHRIALGEITRKALGKYAREALRTNLTEAISAAAQNRFYLDWKEGRHWLEELDRLDERSSSNLTTEDHGSLDAAQNEAMQRALAQLASGDAKISELMKSGLAIVEPLDEALEHYAVAENLYGLLEDVGPVEQEPSRNNALVRRGIAHLLRATDTSLSAEVIAEAIQEGSFALDLAAANLAGRDDMPLTLAEVWDAQAFGLRLEAHFSTEEAAAAWISQAAALHRRASQVEGLPRAVSYRYRVHFFGAERELEERRQSRPEKFKAFRVRIENALDSVETRTSSRTSAAERGSYMALQAEYVMSLVSELKLAQPTDVTARWAALKDETLLALEASTALATDLFLPLDWAMLQHTRAQLARLD